MKRIFLLLAFAGTFAAAKAQVNYGVKAGVNVTNIGGADAENNTARAAIHGGAYADLSVSDKFSIQPELLYSMQGFNFEDVSRDWKYRLSYLNIPVMLKYHVTSPFYIQAGPQFGFLLSAKAKAGSIKRNVKDDFKTFDFGIGLGAGYKFPRTPLGIDARYNIGVSKLGETGTRRIYNRVLQIGLFYQLGSTK